MRNGLIARRPHEALARSGPIKPPCQACLPSPPPFPLPREPLEEQLNSLEPEPEAGADAVPRGAGPAGVSVQAEPWTGVLPVVETENLTTRRRLVFWNLWARVRFSTGTVDCGADRSARTRWAGVATGHPPVSDIQGTSCGYSCLLHPRAAILVVRPRCDAGCRALVRAPSALACASRCTTFSPSGPVPASWSCLITAVHLANDF